MRLAALAFLAGSEHLDGADDSAPSDLVWVASCQVVGLTLAAGRAGHPIHERERVRVSLVGRLADTLTGRRRRWRLDDCVPGRSTG